MILRAVNVIVAVLMVTALGAVYWFGWRPLPRTSGTIPAPLDQPVTVSFDALGEPHIVAADDHDVYFAQGYVTAQERMWQMDALRRLSAGDLAEIVGPAALDSDKEMRRLRMRRIAEAAYIAMPGNERAALAAYAQGVNFYINTRRNRLPVEFTLLGYDPRPWSVIDTILLGLHMYRTLTTTWKDKVQKRDLLAGGDPRKVNFLLPVRSGSEVQPGSNAWAIAGSHTASGRPLLSSDPHLEYSIPGIWYMIHLRAPGLNVAGVSLPGAPGVIIGHNDRIAWGMTNLHFDVQELYVEKFDGRTGRYEFRGSTLQARAERELIPVKGTKPVEMLNWVTVHGPIWIARGNEFTSLRWAAAEPGAYHFIFQDLNRARNWLDFTSALSRFPGPGQNLVYADVDGNIGYHATGMLPIRRNYAGDVPVDGSSGNFEWQGFIPFDQLPSSYNPPGGMIVTANQNPFPRNYPYAVQGNFASQYRSNQIRWMLSGRNRLRPEDTLAIQKDVYSAFCHYLARAVIAAYDRRNNASLTEAISVLRPWNGQMDKDQAAPMIAVLAYQHLRRIVADSASPGKGAIYETQMAPAVVENLLRTRPGGWFADYDQTLLTALTDALDEGRRMQGPNIRNWKYGRYLELLVAHPIGHRIQPLARYFDLGPAPMSGSSTTVKQTTARLGPSMRMNADPGDWERSLMNVPIGQSGHLLSSHYKDQWDAYYNGRSFPMQFNRVEAKSVLRFVPLPSR